MNNKELKAIFDAMTEEEKINELKKCEKDLVYFYNTYMLPDGAREITQEEYNKLMAKRGRVESFRPRSSLYPFIPDETFKVVQQ